MIMSMKEKYGIYVHVPYCERKCLYCDFYSEGVIRADWPRYVNALVAELKMRFHEFSSETSYTLYVGGGTPSLMPDAEFLRLAQGIRDIVGSEPREFTIEVNPDDVTDERCAVWKLAGVNRVSMGVQSLDDKELKAIGRRHDSLTARLAYETLHRCFDNISLDLMFGLPGQTPESLRQTLNEMTEMSPEHISAYSLMYEERTALTRMRDMGRVDEVGEDVSVQMFGIVNSTLAEAGYERYEISNYAKPGRRSQHNSSYWQGTPYIGLGAGAHSYDGKSTRLYNRPDARAYMKAIEAGLPDKVTEVEELTEEELREEMIMTRLRMREGLDLKEYGERFGLQQLMQLMSRARPLVARGCLKVMEDEGAKCLSLTEGGCVISDTIISELF